MTNYRSPISHVTLKTLIGDRITKENFWTFSTNGYVLCLVAGEDIPDFLFFHYSSKIRTWEVKVRCLGAFYLNAKKNKYNRRPLCDKLRKGKQECYGSTWSKALLGSIIRKESKCSQESKRATHRR